MVVATLGVVVLPVGALAVSSQVAAALDGVVVSRQAFKAKAVLALKPGVGTFTAACHNNSFWSRAENEFSAEWSVSSPMALGETPTLAVQRLIYINNRTRCKTINHYKTRPSLCQC